MSYSTPRQYDLDANVVEEIKTLLQYITWVEDEETPKLMFRGQDASLPILPTISRGSNMAATRLLAIEGGVFDWFKAQAYPYLPCWERPRTDWEWLALAQQCRVPCRMTAFTRIPLAALFFACAGQHISDGPASVIACTGVPSLRIEDAPDPFAIGPRVALVAHIAPNRKAIRQKTMWVVHGDPTLPFHPPHQPFCRVRRAVISARSRPQILDRLRRYGITHAMLCPGDLSAIGRDAATLASSWREEELARKTDSRDA